MGKGIKDLVRRSIGLSGPISAHDLSVELGASRQYIHRVLASLVEGGEILKSGVPPRVVYSANKGSIKSAESGYGDTSQVYKITKQHRLERNQQRPVVLWFTGLSGAGKSTIASAVELKLYELELRAYVLDANSVRQSLNRDLSFSPKDRAENIRRIGEVANMFINAGMIVIAASISPYGADRNMVRSLFEEGEFIEIFASCPVEICRERDTKGLYKKASEGLITNFTGIDAPYESPVNPELILETNLHTVDECVDQVIGFLELHSYINK